MAVVPAGSAMGLSIVTPISAHAIRTMAICQSLFRGFGAIVDGAPCERIAPIDFPYDFERVACLCAIDNVVVVRFYCIVDPNVCSY